MKHSPSIKVVASNGKIVLVPLYNLARASERLSSVRADDRIDRIQKVCCAYFKISRQALRSPCRKAHLVRARHIAMYLAKALTVYSLPEIGRRFGDRDHTTALHGVRKIKRMAKTDKQIMADIRALSVALTAAEAR